LLHFPWGKCSFFSFLSQRARALEEN